MVRISIYFFGLMHVCPNTYFRPTQFQVEVGPQVGPDPYLRAVYKKNWYPNYQFIPKASMYASLPSSLSNVFLNQVQFFFLRAFNAVVTFVPMVNNYKAKNCTPALYSTVFGVVMHSNMITGP